MLASEQKGKVAGNYLERMQEKWIGLCTKEEGGKELLGKDAGEVGWPLYQRKKW
jgi:hypothetical protein